MSMIRSDFKWVNFDENFTSSNPSATRTFQIDGNPIDTGYLLIQIRDIDIQQSQSVSSHRISINGEDLPSFDLPIQEGNNRWTTWMDRIPANFLQSGQNRITINREGNSDVFFVANVAVHWRERDSSHLVPHALGVIASTGNLLNNIGIESAERTDTGQYEVILEQNIDGRPVILVTPTIAGFGDPVPTYSFDNASDNRILVRFVNDSGQPRNAPFSILVYGNF